MKTLSDALDLSPLKGLYFHPPKIPPFDSIFENPLGFALTENAAQEVNLCFIEDSDNQAKTTIGSVDIIMHPIKISGVSAWKLTLTDTYDGQCHICFYEERLDCTEDFENLVHCALANSDF